jgi:hypothetical protein
MSQTVVETTAKHVGESVRQASRATGAIADAVEDALGVVRRAVKQGGDAADEFLDDTTHRLHKHLTLTILATFAAGITAGTLIGWTMRRR